jgi:predicted enzyme related to lactoylglutathione lyase
MGVTSLDASMKAVEGAGGKIVVPKMAVPGIGWLAYGVDTEGNQFGMMQSDPAAK